MKHVHRLAASVLLAAGSVTFVGVLAPSPAQAAAEPMGLLHEEQVYGDFEVTGNTVLDCNPAATGCLAARDRLRAASDSPNNNNNGYAMQYVDVDDDAGTYNSSTGTVTIPAGSRVTWARLMWGGNYDGQQCGIGQPGAYPAGSSATAPVRLTVGGGASRDVVPGEHSFDPTSIGYYSADADVTADLAGLPSGQDVTITVGNVYAPTGSGCHGGWSLSVIHTLDAADCGAERRQVFVYDGHVRQSTTPNSTSIPVSGFRVSGLPVRAGIVAYEGDSSQNGDRFYINPPPTLTTTNGIPEPTTALGPNNFFVSAADNKLEPSHPNTFSIDAKKFDVPAGLIDPGDTSAEMRTFTNGDSYMVQALMLSVPVPALCIEKSVEPAVARVGDELTWTITVRNPTTAQALGVTVSDDAVPDCNRSFGSLAPSGSQTYTCTSIATDDLTNVAEAAGVGADGTPLSASGAATVDVIHPSVALEKTADPGVVRAGETVTFTVTATNDGDVPLTDVTISDPDAPGCTGSASLAVGASASIECTVVAGTDDFTNTASVTATPPIGDDVTDVAAAPVDVIHPDVTLIKTTEQDAVTIGDSITFTIEVINSGDVLLTDLTVTDDAAADCARTAGTLSDLAPGESLTYTCAAIADTEPEFRNDATVSGTPPDDVEVSDDASALVEVQDPGLTVTKTADTDLVHEGDDVTFTITVTNSGTVPLDPVVVEDPSFPSCDRADLGPLGVGASVDYDCTVAAPFDDITNTVIASGTSPLGIEVKDTATDFVDVFRTGLTLTKGVDVARVLPGDPVTFTLTVTNTGTATLTDLELDDPAYPACDSAVPDLAPDASTELTCTITAGANDIVNTATVAGHSPTGAVVPASSGTVLVDVIHPALALTKTPAVASTTPGSTVTITITVENTGDVRVDAIEVTDDQVAGCGRSVGDLGVGARASYTCDVTVAAGGHHDVATATGSVDCPDCSSTAVTASDDATIAAVADPDTDPDPEPGPGPNPDPEVAPDNDAALPDTGAPAHTGPLVGLGVTLVLTGLVLVRRRRGEAV
ncbi:DUF7507 domain-containing protein [Nocardioides sp. CPCC 206347]|uniref:DUF7507 domain-containing protein n=2 Tax=Nocardioides TaxID=1839 RepID=UPI003B432F0F